MKSVGTDAIKTVNLKEYVSKLSNVNLNSLTGGSYTIVVNRFAESSDATISRFVAKGQGNETVEGYFLEPGGPSTTKGGQDKRIPAGVYNMEWAYSERFKTYMYLITNSEVPAGRGIRLHMGNYHFDTKGCLLPGSSYDIKNGNYYVSGSKAIYQKLMQLLNTNKATLIINEIPRIP